MLLNLVVDVEKSLGEPIIRHRVAERFSHDAEVERLVRSRYLRILEPYVNVAHVYPEVLNNDFQKFIYEAFFG